MFTHFFSKDVKMVFVSDNIKKITSPDIQLYTFLPVTQKEPAFRLGG